MALSNNERTEILIVAAEASSALYAQRLLEYWRSQEKLTGKKIHAFGVGSHDMESLGFEIIGRSEDMAVVGLTEVIKHYGLIRSVFHRLVDEAKKRRPKVVVLLDYPDFNLRLAKELKALGLKVVYYISPQVWAWRTGRVELIKKFVDRMLVVLPFEKPFYQKHDVSVEFVGHPLLDEISGQLYDDSERQKMRSRYGVTENDHLVGLMPGSRHSELKHHLETQLKTAEMLLQDNPSLKFALLVAPNFSVDEMRAIVPKFEFPLIFIKDDPLKMARMTDVVLCASGTATLVVGLMERPMVIMYKINRFSAWIARRFVKGTSQFGLINLILGKPVVAELFQNEAEPPRLKAELSRLLYDKSEYERVRAELAHARELLGSRGATDKVARALEEFLH